MYLVKFHHCLYFREKAAVEFMKDDHFRSSAFLIIDEMVELSRRRPSVLVDEVCPMVSVLNFENVCFSLCHNVAVDIMLLYNTECDLFSWVF